LSNPSVKGIGRLAYQFNDSEKFKSFLESFLLQSDEIQIANTQLLDDRELDSAEGEQLSGIGDIVGVERPPGVTDAVYVWMIRAKIMINNTDMTVKKMLELLDFIFEGKTIEYRNRVNLSSQYIISGTLTTDELTVFELIPTTLGVGVDYISIPDDSVAFSFLGGTGPGFATLAAPTSGGSFALIIN